LPGLGAPTLDRLSPQSADPRLVAQLIRALNALAERVGGFQRERLAGPMSGSSRSSR
jgi:hypothetical protein